MESPKSHASEVVKSNAVVHSASSSAVPRQPRGDRQEDSESERLRGTVQSLKGERNALQLQLQEKAQPLRCVSHRLHMTPLLWNLLAPHVLAT